MDGMMAVAERLAEEFAGVPSSTVIRVLTDCVDDFPDDGAHFVEQAARARLMRAETALEEVDGGEDRHPAQLAASDPLWAEEAEMVALLVIAAHKSDVPLRQQEIDRILDVTPGA